MTLLVVKAVVVLVNLIALVGMWLNNRAKALRQKQVEWGID